MKSHGVDILLDAIYVREFFVTGGLHGSPIIIYVISHSGATSGPGVNKGTHYKDGGLFKAPYIGVGKHTRPQYPNKYRIMAQRNRFLLLE